MRQSRDYTWAETAVRAGVCLVLAEYALTACSHPFQPNRVSALDQTYEFTLLGIEHILTGYDHLLFLLGLHILDRKITHVLKIITAFTLAHSLTLALAALDVVVLPARLVETTIALSIAYIAVECQRRCKNGSYALSVKRFMRPAADTARVCAEGRIPRDRTSAA